MLQVRDNLIPENVVSALRLSGVPPLWTVEGARIFGKLLRESRKATWNNRTRQFGLNTRELSEYIQVALSVRGACGIVSVSAKTIESLEVPDDPPIPKHNTVVAIHAAQIIRHPDSRLPLSLEQLSLVLSNLYDPYTERCEIYLGVPDPDKIPEPIELIGGFVLMATPQGIKQLAAVLKMARIQRGLPLEGMVNLIESTTGIRVSRETLQDMESGILQQLQADVLMAIAATEYAINPRTERPYSIQDILNILNGRLTPLNPRSNRPFSLLDFEFLEIDPENNGVDHAAKD